MTARTHQDLIETMVVWVGSIVGGEATVYQGGRGAVTADPRVAVTVRSSVSDGPVETEYDGIDAMRSEVMISTVELAAEGSGYPGDLTRRLRAAWTSDGPASAPLRAAGVLPVGPAGSVVEGTQPTGVASMIRRSVMTVRVRHRIAWREADGAADEARHVAGDIDGDAPTAYTVRLVPVLSGAGAMLVAGFTALELSP